METTSIASRAAAAPAAVCTGAAGLAQPATNDDGQWTVAARDYANTR